MGLRAYPGKSARNVYRDKVAEHNLALRTITSNWISSARTTRQTHKRSFASYTRLVMHSERTFTLSTQRGPRDAHEYAPD